MTTESISTLERIKSIQWSQPRYWFALFLMLTPVLVLAWGLYESYSAHGEVYTFLFSAFVGVGGTYLIFNKIRMMSLKKDMIDVEEYNYRSKAKKIKKLKATEEATDVEDVLKD